MPPKQRTHCVFSNIWIYALENMHNFRYYPSHGEFGDADYAGAAEPLPRLRELA